MPGRRKSPASDISTRRKSPASDISTRRKSPGDEEAGEPAGKLAPGLYIVATPIGNASDITLRALDVLKRVDAIACEDTRVTARLAAIHGIKRPMLPYHEHNARHMRPKLLAQLAAGERIALVSDAGTPLLSDPGYQLVRDCIAAGIALATLPGPVAAIAALTLAGQPTDRVLFVGFLPAKASARRQALAEIVAVKATLVFYEAPHRVAASLADMAAMLGPRAAALAREITKLFEEVRRAPLSELAAHYAAAGAPKGEIAIVVGPPAAARHGESPAEPPDAAIDAALSEAMAAGHSIRDAASLVARSLGWPRRAVYARALKRAPSG